MNFAATAADYAGRSGRWSAIGLGFTIPISVALDNVLLAIVLAGYLLGGAYREKWRVIRDNPVTLAALCLYALLIAGTAYGERNPGDAATYLVKYLDLLFIPVFAFLLRDAAARRHAIHAFAVSLALVLGLSYLIKVGLVPSTSWLLGNPDYPVVLKQRLTHNILMAYGAFLFTHLAVTATTRNVRMLWSALAVLALVNVVFMIQGATGYLVLGTLVLYLGFGWRSWRGLAFAAGVVAIATAVLALVPGSFHQKVTTIASEVSQWRPGQADTTSAGLRLEFYRNSLAIVREHPLLGVGTGGFPRAYAEQVRGTGMTEARNPHNEYLLIAVQTGFVGLALLLHLFWQQWRLATRLATPLETRLARGLVLTIAVGCLFNSLLLDHTEGLLFAWLTGLLYAGYNQKGNG